MNDSTDQAPNYPPEFWVAKASYSNVPITLDGPVARWADKLVEPYGYRWTHINEWRFVGGDVPFAQFHLQATRRRPRLADHHLCVATAGHSRLGNHEVALARARLILRECHELRRWSCIVTVG